MTTVSAKPKSNTPWIVAVVLLLLMLFGTIVVAVLISAALAMSYQRAQRNALAEAEQSAYLAQRVANDRQAELDLEVARRRTGMALDREALDMQLQQAAERAAVAEKSAKLAEEKASTNAQLRAQIDQQQKEIALLRADLGKFQAERVDRDKLLNAVRDESQELKKRLAAEQVSTARWEKEAEVHANRLRQVMDQLAEARTELARLKSSGKQPPQPPGAMIEVRGRVVDVSNGQIRLSVGSNAGVVDGMELDAYRLKPATYLGKVKITKVSANESVGTFTPIRPSMKLQVDDEVSNKVGR